MIEVEKKFLLSESDKSRLTKDAEFLSERIFTDIYYDTADYSLTTKDQWLRKRENRFELKLPMHAGSDRLVDQYRELDDEKSIREALNIPLSESLSNDLSVAGYSPFCTCTTTRRKYARHPFIIDLDSVDFRDFTYSIGEIELMLKDAREIEAAIEKIMEFAKELNLTIAPVRGKVLEYMKRMKPDHYQALIQAHVIKEHE